MNATFSFETQELLDRAERAVERSIKLREQSARGIAEAKRWSRYVEINLYWESAPPGGAKKKENPGMKPGQRDPRLLRVIETRPDIGAALPHAAVRDRRA